jgi:hypothetical protein
MRRDSEAPEVADSGKQKGIAESGTHLRLWTLPIAKLEIVRELIFSFSYESCAAIDHSPVCRGPRGSLTAPLQCTRTADSCLKI